MGRNDSNLPVNLAAEREVLGALIEEPALLSEAIAMGLSSDDLSLADHRRIFSAMVALREQGHPIDYITLAEHLGNRSADFALMSDLISGVVVSRGHVLHHVGIVRKKAGLRNLIKLSEWMALAAGEDGADPKALIKGALEKLEYLG
jgi:replicative DNA helicase